MKLHPLNVHFEWKPTVGPFRRITDAQARFYDENGYLVLEHALPPDEVADLTAEIDRFEVQARRERNPDEFMAMHGGFTTFVLRLAARSARVRELCFSPLFQDLLADLVGPDVWMRYDHSIYKKPHGAGPLAWHQDNAYPFIEPQQHVSFWIALTDMTEENGCLWVEPRGHLKGTYEHWRDRDGWICSDETPPAAIPLPISAGSLVIQSAVLPHSSGPNQTALERKALSFIFIPEGAYMTFDVDGQRVRSPCTTGIRVLAGGRPPAGESPG